MRCRSARRGRAPTEGCQAINARLDSPCPWATGNAEPGAGEVPGRRVEDRGEQVVVGPVGAAVEPSPRVDRGVVVHAHQIGAAIGEGPPVGLQLQRRRNDAAHLGDPREQAAARQAVGAQRQVLRVPLQGPERHLRDRGGREAGTELRRRESSHGKSMRLPMAPALPQARNTLSQHRTALFPGRHVDDRLH